MLSPPIWPDLPNAISSPGLAAGPARYASPDGPTTGPCGPEARPASPSAPQERASGETMPDTSAPILSDWSGPAAPLCCLASKSPVRQSSERLQAALESKLRERLNGRGLMIYATDWKPHVTPLGRAIFRLRASAHRTSDSGLSSERCGWPTPNTPSGGRSVSIKKMDATGRTADGKKHTASLEHAVKFAGWPTPRSADGEKNVRSEEGSAREMERKGGPQDLMQGASLAGWPTPNAGPQNDTDTKWRERREAIKAERKNGNGFGLTLGMAVQEIGPMRLTARGELLTGSTAAMPSGGQLNPAHSRWLMGYPPEWDDCAAMAMPSSRKQRQSSSAPLKTPGPTVFD